MFDHLTPTERRQVLLASRVRFGVETRVPRERAIDKIIENALSMANREEWFTSIQIREIFSDIGGLATLRLVEINYGLTRLLNNGRVEARIEKPHNRYRLSVRASEETQADFVESSRRLERVLCTLYEDVLDPRPAISAAPFFLEFVCEVFRFLGSQWVSYINGDPLGSLIDTGRLETIAEEKTRKFGFEDPSRTDVKRRSIEFFQLGDPDFDYIKFALGQSFYVAQLLGIGGKDLLSEEIFSNGTLYLDSSVVIPALLPDSRHHQVFKELCEVCKRLKVSLFVARPTVDEVRWVAAGQEKIAPTLYDQVPEKLAPQVRGDFFHAYLSLKKSNPEVNPAEVFATFHDLPTTLRQSFGVETIDDRRFQDVVGTPEYDMVVGVLNECSIEVRKRKKFRETLAHDAKLYLFLQSECRSPGDKIWFLTRDTSLPAAWSKLQPGGLTLRCFMLDGLLQSISPFVVADGEGEDFSSVFSQVIAAQLLPQGKLFDVDDFLLFQDMEIDCNEIPEAELRDCLLSVKKHVLKGASYRRQNFEEAAYEIRRYLAQHNEHMSALTKDRENLEKKLAEVTKTQTEQVQILQEEHNKEIAQLQEGHTNQMGELRFQLSELLAREEAQRKRRAAWFSLAKKALSLLVFLSSIALVTWAANRWAPGENLLQRALAFLQYYAVGAVVALLLVKLAFFRREKLSDVFGIWQEIKNLLH